MGATVHRGEQLVSAIGRRIELTSGAITTAVDRLEARGFVCRQPDSEDRRSRLVSLTNGRWRRSVKCLRTTSAPWISAASGLERGTGDADRADEEARSDCGAAAERIGRRNLGLSSWDDASQTPLLA